MEKTNTSGNYCPPSDAFMSVWGSESGLGGRRIMHSTWHARWLDEPPLSWFHWIKGGFGETSPMEEIRQLGPTELCVTTFLSQQVTLWLCLSVWECSQTLCWTLPCLWVMVKNSSLKKENKYFEQCAGTERPKPPRLHRRNCKRSVPLCVSSVAFTTNSFWTLFFGFPFSLNSPDLCPCHLGVFLPLVMWAVGTANLGNIKVILPLWYCCSCRKLEVVWIFTWPLFSIKFQELFSIL